MKPNELTTTIIGAASTVHETLGPGLRESAYRFCLAHELRKQGLTVELEQPIPVVYKGIRLERGYCGDLFVEGLVIVECKTKEDLHSVDESQLQSYLRLLDLRIGLLINFQERDLKDGISRIVNDYRAKPTAGKIEPQRAQRTRRTKELSALRALCG